MDRTQLAALLASRNLTLDQLRDRDPALASALDAQVRARTTRASNTVAATTPKSDGSPARTPGALLSLVANQPIAGQPGVAPELERARLYQVGSVAGLTDGVVDSLVDNLRSPNALTDANLRSLVSAGKLTASQAHDLGLAGDLFQLAEGDVELARAIRTASVPRLGNRAARSTVELALLSPADWESLLTSGKVAAPAGSTVQDIARSLAGRFSALHSSVALLSRFPVIDVQVLRRNIEALEPLLPRNPHLYTTAFDKLDTTGLSPPQVDALRRTHSTMRSFVAAYPGLELALVLEDPRSDASKKAEVVARRVGLLSALGQRVAEIDLLHLDFSTDVAELGLDRLGANADEARMVVALLKTYQRVYAVTKNIDQAHALIAAGFTSAFSIAARSYSSFQAATRIVDSATRAIWEDARAHLADTTLSLSSLVDVYHGLFDDLPVGNTSPAAKDYFTHLAGFADLFGNLSFCDCQHCQSILGPAAYFVDLMKFVDEGIRSQLAVPGHALDLKTRRPDLWTLPLTCENTNERVPTLEIINEILENNVASRLGYTGSFADRIAIERLVYAQTLPQEVDSFTQPFHLPLARIGPLLDALGHRRIDVAEALGAPQRIAAQAELELSPGELEIVATADIDLSHLSHVYGIAFVLAGTTLAPVDAELLRSAMSLSRSELGELAATHFVAAGGAVLHIKAEKRDARSVQNDVERVRGLTADALDRMHRMTRLRRKLPWSFAELDLIFTTLAATTLSTTEVASISATRRLQERLDVSVESLCALIGAMPAALLDRCFNPPSLVAADGALPKSAARFIHPAFRVQNAATPPDPALPRLSSGLGVTLDGLGTLARRLASCLGQETQPGFNPDDPDESRRYFVLSAANLTLLYRHARLAGLLALSLDDFFQLLDLCDLPAVRDAADLGALLDFNAWWRKSGYRLDDLSVAVGRSPRDPSRYPNPQAVAENAVAGAADALSFKDTLFSVALGATEKGSRDIVAANAQVIEPAAGDAYRLKAGVDLATSPLIVPPSVSATVEEIRSALFPYQAPEVLLRLLGASLGQAPAKVRALASLCGQPVAADAIVRAVRGDGPIAPLRTLVSALMPLHAAFASPVWTPAAIEFVRLHGALFATEPLPHPAPESRHPNAPFLTVTQLRALSVLARYPDGATDLQTVLAAFDPAIPGFPAAVDAALARMLGVGAGVVVGLRGRVAMPAVAAPALDRFTTAVQLARDLGLDGESLAALASEDYGPLSRAADALESALRARHEDEISRTKALDDAQQPVRAARRDALAAHLQHSLAPAVFGSMEDLSAYFLMDVLAGGCATTSRVVAATASVQLYVHRVIMGLEKDALPPLDPGHVALAMPPEAAAEWDWRKNYRVWEANRKVFLWPENYLEPDLRDDKTPQFKELEQELLQTEIGEQNVLDAYAKYLKDFEDVSSMRIAGAYHDRRQANDRTVDVLHLFGVSASDPPTYYYRTAENLIGSGRDPSQAALWTPWQKVSVQITGRRVAPIVHRGRLHVFWTDIKSRPINKVHDGGSEFSGYQHKLAVRFTTLRPDGTWTAPQAMTLPREGFDPVPGIIPDQLDDTGTPRFDTRRHPDPIDDYTLVGPNWDWMGLATINGTLQVDYRNYMEHGRIDLFKKGTDAGSDLDWPSPSPQVLCARGTGTSKPLYYGIPILWWGNRNTYPQIAIDEARIDEAAMDITFVKPWIQQGLYVEQIATLTGDVELVAIPGSVEDGIAQVGPDVLLLQGSVTDDAGYVLRRIGTTLAESIARRLFEDGLDGLLDIQTQLALAEAGLPMTLVGSRIENRSNAGQLDFKGPYGIYYRELFFHIPLLIAESLRSRGRFAAAQRWYHYIFDPTASEAIFVPPDTPPDEVPHRLLDRVWRYREFRNLDLERLREILTDEVAIALYKKDPFNPHAIARRRISAYQKSVVMKYVANLLDWADFLFTQFSTESVNEAQMLYVMAQDVLGARPTELGDCGEGAVVPRTYERIGPLIDGNSEILVELESWIFGRRLKARKPHVGAASSGLTLDRPAILHAIERIPLAVAHPAIDRATAAAASSTTMAAAETSGHLFQGTGWKDTQIASWSPPRGSATKGNADRTTAPVKSGGFADWAGKFGWCVLRQHTPVFCVPPNKDLLAYWDRVEERLFKIRHCMDITGQGRELALFAPEIDPRLLVRMRAAGLTLEDVFGTQSGNLPPYRFLFLVDRAKALAASLSGFGAQLLAALEKKDGEELSRLRIVQQQNLTRMTTQIRRWEITTAEDALDSLNKQLESAEYRRDFYDGLVSSDRNGWEVAESIARHAASGALVTESVLDTIAAITALQPQVGSPFAMKYGGVEVSSSLQRFGNASGAIAHGLEAIASSAALEAEFARRSEGWAHQKKLAEGEIATLRKQIDAADLRRQIAERSIEIHEKNIEQLDEMLELTDGKFSSLGLYTWMSTQLQRLYRGAYQNALTVAKLAEQAFRFEREDENAPGLAPSYWDATRAGLLAGEQLLLDLQTLERRYLESNYRSLEVDQAFALSQIDPAALVILRETGECEFEVPEVFFDLFYPGHYRRRIKSARLTIPCITGPYVNVSATLSLVRSWMRPVPNAGQSLTEVPPRRSVSVAASTAQNDAGVFELSFRDERYMPFEGAGAISRWSLRLPKTFRQFDYDTINDVVLSISYTADQDGALRDRVETANAQLEGTLLRVLSQTAARRVFSLRQDFSTAFSRLLHSPAGTPVKIELTDRHFPLFARGRTLHIDRGVLLLRTAQGIATNGVEIQVDGAALSGFAADLGGMPGKALPGAFINNLRSQHTLTIAAAGALAPTTPQAGDPSVVDADRLLDIIVYLEYRLT
jgi:hypothetical protein